MAENEKSEPVNVVAPLRTVERPSYGKDTIERGGELAPMRKAGGAEYKDFEESKLNRELRKRTQYVLLIQFCLANSLTIGLFIWKAWGNKNISDTVLGDLAAMTIAEVAGLMYVSARHLFPGEPPKPGRKK